MKKDIYIVIMIIIFNVCFGCTTTSKTKKEREPVKVEIFFQSIRNGDFAEVKGLIDAGADVNARNNDKFTALIWASLFGHKDIIRLFVEEGADINARPNDGYTALMFASELGHSEVVKLLIDADKK